MHTATNQSNSDMSTITVSKQEDKMTERIEETLMTATEAGYLLGRSEKTVYRMIRQGIIQPVKIGGSTFIRRADIANLIAGKSEVA